MPRLEINQLKLQPSRFFHLLNLHSEDQTFLWIHTQYLAVGQKTAFSSCVRIHCLPSLKWPSSLSYSESNDRNTIFEPLFPFLLTIHRMLFEQLGNRIFVLQKTFAFRQLRLSCREANWMVPSRRCKEQSSRSDLDNGISHQIQAFSPHEHR